MIITFHESNQVPVTIHMKNPEIKAKVLGIRNGVTKLNVFYPFPQGATIAYTRTKPKVAPGLIDTFDQRFVHHPKSPSHEFPELHTEFHAVTTTKN